MSDVERHAELAYQEHLLIKAVLGILYSADWLHFIKEALNLRSANIAYRNMNDFLKQADATAGGHDVKIDEHFRSGVLFGTAINSLILSLLPSRVFAVSCPKLSCMQRQSNDSHLIRLFLSLGTKAIDMLPLRCFMRLAVGPKPLTSLVSPRNKKGSEDR
jgi:hypothetical protein